MSVLKNVKNATDRKVEKRLKCKCWWEHRWVCEDCWCDAAGYEDEDERNVPDYPAQCVRCRRAATAVLPADNGEESSEDGDIAGFVHHVHGIVLQDREEVDSRGSDCSDPDHRDHDYGDDDDDDDDGDEEEEDDA